MEHKRFNECLLVTDIDGHDEVGSSAYMIPEDLYMEMRNSAKQHMTAWNKYSLLTQTERQALFI